MRTNTYQSNSANDDKNVVLYGSLLSVSLFACFLCVPAGFLVHADQPLDPAAWGSDHVGQSFPEYVTGDECLFCHRTIGPTWDVNPHNRTFRGADPDDPAMRLLAEESSEAARESDLLLGARRITRFLRRSRAYGKLDMLTTAYEPSGSAASQAGKRTSGKLVCSENPQWDSNLFADRCAGCHTTAVDAQTRAFSALSLDCIACHGEVPLEHTSDISLVWLSSKNSDPKHVQSICGQCHLRGGKSASTGLPYANTFVPGDNLFRDFKVDWSDPAVAQMPIAQQHIYLNARDVMVNGKTELSCISCHDVHRDDSEKHQSLSDATICASCHQGGTDNTELLETYVQQRGQRIHNQTCDY